MVVERDVGDFQRRGRLEINDFEYAVGDRSIVDGHSGLEANLWTDVKWVELHRYYKIMKRE